MYDDDELPPRKQRSPVAWLGMAALITIVIWQMPMGSLMLYPFSILATWFHEMGHGLTALLMGGGFKQLVLFPDGSGVAWHTTQGRLQQVMVSAGGLLGPPLAGAGLILSGTSASRSRLALTSLGLLLLISTLIWVRGAFGWVILPPLGLSLLWAGRKGPDWLQPVLIQFLGVQACISSFQQLDYLFMQQANLGGQVMLSDTGKMAEHLFLPHWFWGGLIALISFALLAGSLRQVARRQKL
jgi:hypothetical protein